VCCLIDCDILELTQIDDQMSVFSSETMCTITVASRPRSDKHTVLHSARHGILNMLNGLRNSNTSWLEGKAEIEGLDSLCIVLCVLYEHRDLGSAKTIAKCCPLF
jgi:hypothetical protein